MFSSFGFKPRASGFQSFSYSSLKTSPSKQPRWWNIYVNDKTVLHSKGHPERFTKLHTEEKREKGDRGAQEEKRGNQKQREQLRQ